MKTILILMTLLLIGCNQDGTSSYSEQTQPNLNKTVPKINYLSLDEQLGQYETKCFTGVDFDYKYTLFFDQNQITMDYYVTVKRYDYDKEYMCNRSNMRGALVYMLQIEDYRQFDNGVKGTIVADFYLNKATTIDRMMCGESIFGLDLIHISTNFCKEPFMNSLKKAELLVEDTLIFNNMQLYRAIINTDLYE